MDSVFRSPHELVKFQQILLDWFRDNKRPLPWRNTYNPYHIWISEIMLQQTQMDRGVSYFLKWINRFPTVLHVAQAREQEILKMWEGLGYYTRARNLHKCAKVIVQEHDSIVPSDVKILKKLPGIGDYTSAAIASVAGDVDVAAIDANVIRILTRVFDIDKPVKEKVTANKIKVLAEDFLVNGQARYWNQALMDLGGLICKPKNPRCEKCPVVSFCLAAQRDTVVLRPLSVKKKKKIKQLQKVSLLLIAEGKVAIEKCYGENNLWQGLWELPSLTFQETTQPQQACDELLLKLNVRGKKQEFVTLVDHAYTTNKVKLFSFMVCLDNIYPELVTNFIWCSAEQLKEHGFSAGSRKILEYISSYREDILKLIS